ncbi:MAG: hypothetical protein ACRBBK_12530 [Paracoccaceae bacterium]
MAQDGTFISATPRESTDAYQALMRAPAVRHHNRRGFSQSFRGVVGTNSTTVLHTRWPVDWSPNITGAGVTSELTIFTSTNRVGTGTTNTYGEKFSGPKANASKVSKVWGAAQKLNRIRGIIQAPIDQILQMEIAFGDFNSDEIWKGNYASGATYKIKSNGAASAAMIKLTCHNPLNPGPFNFMASISLIPAPSPTRARPTSQPKAPGFFEEFKDTFYQGIREMEKGNFPF